MSAICLVQLAAPGSPVIYRMFSGVMNPFTGGCLVSSDLQHLFYAGTVQLGHFYNLPVMSTYGGSDLADIDSWKTGKDESIDAFFITATGPDMLPCLGLMECYTLLCHEKILFDNDIFESIRFLSEGLTVDRDSLALDDILSVGPGGHFMDRQQTIQQIRGHWNSGIGYQWSKSDKAFAQPRQTAREQVKWILNHHRPEPLAAEVGAELQCILDRAKTAYGI